MLLYACECVVCVFILLEGMSDIITVNIGPNNHFP